MVNYLKSEYDVNDKVKTSNKSYRPTLASQLDLSFPLVRCQDFFLVHRRRKHVCNAKSAPMIRVRLLTKEEA